METLEENSSCAMLDLYDDLITDEGVKKQEDFKQLEDKYRAALDRICCLEKELHESIENERELKKKSETLEKNITDLLVTAKAEIQRKDRELAELRRSGMPSMFKKWQHRPNVRQRRNSQSDTGDSEKATSELSFPQGDKVTSETCNSPKQHLILSENNKRSDKEKWQMAHNSKLSRKRKYSTESDRDNDSKKYKHERYTNNDQIRRRFDENNQRVESHTRHSDETSVKTRSQAPQSSKQETAKRLLEKSKRNLHRKSSDDNKSLQSISIDEISKNILNIEDEDRGVLDKENTNIENLKDVFEPENKCNEERVEISSKEILGKHTTSVSKERSCTPDERGQRIESPSVKRIKQINDRSYRRERNDRVISPTRHSHGTNKSSFTVNRKSRRDSRRDGSTSRRDGSSGRENRPMYPRKRSLSNESGKDRSTSRKVKHIPDKLSPAISLTDKNSVPDSMQLENDSKHSANDHNETNKENEQGNDLGSESQVVLDKSSANEKSDIKKSNTRKEKVYSLHTKSPESHKNDHYQSFKSKSPKDKEKTYDQKQKSESPKDKDKTYSRQRQRSRSPNIYSDNHKDQTIKKTENRQKVLNAKNTSPKRDERSCSTNSIERNERSRSTNSIERNTLRFDISPKKTDRKLSNNKERTESGKSDSYNKKSDIKTRNSPERHMNKAASRSPERNRSNSSSRKISQSPKGNKSDKSNKTEKLTGDRQGDVKLDITKYNKFKSDDIKITVQMKPNKDTDIETREIVFDSKKYEKKQVDAKYSKNVHDIDDEWDAANYRSKSDYTGDKSGKDKNSSHGKDENKKDRGRLYTQKEIKDVHLHGSSREIYDEDSDQSIDTDDYISPKVRSCVMSVISNTTEKDSTAKKGLKSKKFHEDSEKRKEHKSKKAEIEAHLKSASRKTKRKEDNHENLSVTGKERNELLDLQKNREALLKEIEMLNAMSSEESDGHEDNIVHSNINKSSGLYAGKAEDVLGNEYVTKKDIMQKNHHQKTTKTESSKANKKNVIERGIDDTKSTNQSLLNDETAPKTISNLKLKEKSKKHKEKKETEHMLMKSREEDYEKVEAKVIAKTEQSKDKAKRKEKQHKADQQPTIKINKNKKSQQVNKDESSILNTMSNDPKQGITKEIDDENVDSYIDRTNIDFANSSQNVICSARNTDVKDSYEDPCITLDYDEGETISEKSEASYSCIVKTDVNVTEKANTFESESENTIGKPDVEIKKFKDRDEDPEEGEITSDSDTELDQCHKKEEIDIVKSDVNGRFKTSYLKSHQHARGRLGSSQEKDQRGKEAYRRKCSPDTIRRDVKEIDEHERYVNKQKEDRHKERKSVENSKQKGNGREWDRNRNKADESKCENKKAVIHNVRTKELVKDYTGHSGYDKDHFKESKEEDKCNSGYDKDSKKESKEGHKGNSGFNKESYKESKKDENKSHHMLDSGKSENKRVRKPETVHKKVNSISSDNLKENKSKSNKDINEISSFDDTDSRTDNIYKLEKTSKVDSSKNKNGGSEKSEASENFTKDDYKKRKSNIETVDREKDKIVTNKEFHRSRNHSTKGESKTKKNKPTENDDDFDEVDGLKTNSGLIKIKNQLDEANTKFGIDKQYTDSESKIGSKNVSNTECYRIGESADNSSIKDLDSNSTGVNKVEYVLSNIEMKDTKLHKSDMIDKHEKTPEEMLNEKSCLNLNDSNKWDDRNQPIDSPTTTEEGSYNITHTFCVAHHPSDSDSSEIDIMNTDSEEEEIEEHANENDSSARVRMYQQYLENARNDRVKQQRSEEITKTNQLCNASEINRDSKSNLQLANTTGSKEYSDSDKDASCTPSVISGMNLSSGNTSHVLHSSEDIDSKNRKRQEIENYLFGYENNIEGNKSNIEYFDFEKDEEVANEEIVEGQNRNNVKFSGTTCNIFETESPSPIIEQYPHGLKQGYRIPKIKRTDNKDRQSLEKWGKSLNKYFHEDKSESSGRIHPNENANSWQTDEENYRKNDMNNKEQNIQKYHEKRADRNSDHQRHRHRSQHDEGRSVPSKEHSDTKRDRHRNSDNNCKD